MLLLSQTEINEALNIRVEQPLLRVSLRPAVKPRNRQS